MSETQNYPWVFPRERLTWDHVRAYYRLVAARMLPYIADRPLTLIVCPLNIYLCKFTKHATNLPPPVKAIDAGHAEAYIAIDSAEGLMTLVEQGAVEFHAWQSRHTRLEYPDRLLFDLDPPEDGSVPWDRLGEAALLLKIHLQTYHLDSFLQTTGGKGYYVVVPLKAVIPWKDVTVFAKQVAEEMAEVYPDRFTVNLSKGARGGKIFVDWVRNGRGANAAEPYSLRARPGAPIALPITWEELVAGAKPDSFNLLNIHERLAGLAGDPWQEYFAVEQELPM